MAKDKEKEEPVKEVKPKAHCSKCKRGTEWPFHVPPEWRCQCPGGATIEAKVEHIDDLYPYYWD
jgi:hypothetical protein